MTRSFLEFAQERGEQQRVTWKRVANRDGNVFIAADGELFQVDLATGSATSLAHFKFKGGEEPTNLEIVDGNFLLASSQKKLLDTDADHHRSDVARLKESAAKAHEAYRRAVLDWASPETSQFSMVSYATMIDGLEELAGRLRASSTELPTEDRIELDADLVRLDEIIGRWRASMLSSMGGTVA